MRNKYDKKLTAKDVWKIPKLLKTTSIGGVAEKLGVSWQAVWYWVKRLREKGVEIETRKKGRPSTI